MTCASFRFSGVSYSVKDRVGHQHVIVKDVSAGFACAAAAIITGPTGSGKSTLLHLAAGILRPTAGSIETGGQRISHWTSAHRDRWRQTVGIVLQTPQLVEDLSVLENVLMPLIPLRETTMKEKTDAAMASLRRVHMDAWAHAAVNSLSGGERQRTAIARATARQNGLLLLDEPSSHQDDTGIGMILDCIGDEVRRQTAVIVVSHDPRLTGASVFSASYRMSGGILREET